MAQSKAAEPAGENGTQDELSSRHFWTLVVGSIGVVYGDIGTSPLYALREAVVAARHGGIGRSRGGARRPVADRLGARSSS